MLLLVISVTEEVVDLCYYRFSSAVRRMPGDLYTVPRIISSSPLSLATDVTDATLGASGDWLGTLPGAGSVYTTSMYMNKMIIMMKTTDVLIADIRLEGPKWSIFIKSYMIFRPCNIYKSSYPDRNENTARQTLI